MIKLAHLLMCIVSLGFLTAASARTPDLRAQAVVAASKAATGGHAWDSLDSCYEEGTHGGGALTYKTWFSMRRYGMRVESRRGGDTRIRGFNGRIGWQTNPAGGVETSSDEESLREAITSAYLSSNLFFFPDRFPAEVIFVREAELDGRGFDVLRITPEGGRALDYWFDRATRHLSRVVDNRQSPPLIVEAGDYRRSGDIDVAFRLTVKGPDGQIVDQGQVTSLACRPTDRALFDPPAAD